MRISIRIKDGKYIFLSHGSNSQCDTQSHNISQINFRPQMQPQYRISEGFKLRPSCSLARPPFLQPFIPKSIATTLQHKSLKAPALGEPVNAHTPTTHRINTGTTRATFKRCCSPYIPSRESNPSLHISYRHDRRVQPLHHRRIYNPSINSA
jgi:hypothetical protein